MHRHSHALAFAALLLLAACPKTNNNVGTVEQDSGAGGQTSPTGGATTATGGAGGHSSAATGGSPTLGGSSGSGGAASCLYKGVTYAMGTSFKDDCNTCMCGRFGDAIVSCTVMACGDGSVGPSGSIDAPLDGPIDTQPVDSDGCPAPKVWRYEQAGCDGQVQPVCGQAGGDACLSFACGCDGESLAGCDYYSKPYRSAGGLCPGACFSPTHNLQVVENGGPHTIPGCACDPATDQPQCVSVGAGRTGYGLGFTCTGGVWNVKSLPSCNLGASCDVGAAVPPAAAGFNLSAPECSIGLCLKPVVPSAAGNVDTGAFCTNHCNTDDDCTGGRNRDPSNPNDRTCTSGYTCGMPFVKGDLCCQNLCVCKDFTGGASMPAPIACQGTGTLTCNQ